MCRHYQRISTPLPPARDVRTRQQLEQAAQQRLSKAEATGATPEHKSPQRRRSSEGTLCCELALPQAERLIPIVRLGKLSQWRLPGCREDAQTARAVPTRTSREASPAGTSGCIATTRTWRKPFRVATPSRRTQSLVPKSLERAPEC